MDTVNPQSYPNRNTPRHTMSVWDRITLLEQDVAGLLAGVPPHPAVPPVVPAVPIVEPVPPVVAPHATDAEKQALDKIFGK